jgi:hypothetical protein
MGARFTQAGGLYRILKGENPTTSTDLSLAIQYMAADRQNPIDINPLLKRNITLEDANMLIDEIYNGFQNGTNELFQKACEVMVRGGITDFYACTYDDTQKTNIPIVCYQREFRKAGCQPAGAAYPTSLTSASIANKAWGTVKEEFNKLHATLSDNTLPGDVHDAAVKNCLGIDVKRKPYIPCVSDPITIPDPRTDLSVKDTICIAGQTFEQADRRCQSMRKCKGFSYPTAINGVPIKNRLEPTLKLPACFYFGELPKDMTGVTKVDATE